MEMPDIPTFLLVANRGKPMDAQTEPVNPLADFSDEALIAAFRNFRDVQLEQIKKEYDAATKPITSKMQAITTEMQRRLLERKANHSTTDAGTAYLSTTLSATCKDRDAFLQYCVENFDGWGKGLLTANVGKETLEQFLDASKTAAHPNGQSPPGIECSYITKCNIRK